MNTNFTRENSARKKHQPSIRPKQTYGNCLADDRWVRVSPEFLVSKRLSKTSQVNGITDDLKDLLLLPLSMQLSMRYNVTFAVDPSRPPQTSLFWYDAKLGGESSKKRRINLGERELMPNSLLNTKKSRTRLPISRKTGHSMNMAWLKRDMRLILPWSRS